jgi:hypothetical protein
VVSNDGLVEDDYYKQGLTVNQRTVRDQRAAELGIEAELVMGGEGDRLRALLRAKEGGRLPETLNLGHCSPHPCWLRSEGDATFRGVEVSMRGESCLSVVVGT